MNNRPKTAAQLLAELSTPEKAIERELNWARRRVVELEIELELVRDAARRAPVVDDVDQLAGVETEAGEQIVRVYVAGNATIHAGRRIGTYESGRPRYRKLCSNSNRENHDPSPIGGTPAITCKRCLAKLPA